MVTLRCLFIQKQVLSPKDVTSLLMGVDNQSKVCNVPPTGIANNVTFLVDLQGLKFDDMGHGRNNSSKKFSFYVEWTDDLQEKYIQVKIVRERDSK